MTRRDALILVAPPVAVVSSGQGCSRSAISSETRCRRSGLARRRSSWSRSPTSTPMRRAP